MSHASKTARGKRSGGNYRREIARPLMYKQVSFQSPKENRARVFALTCGLGLALAVVLGLALMVFIGHGGNIASASGGGPTSGPGGYGSLNHPKGPCGNAGQAPCSAVDPGWFPITSTSPTVVATAI